MRLAKSLAVLALILFSISCQNSNQELYDQVMSVHDEVMPRMDDLYKVRTSLQKQLDSADYSEAEKQKIKQKIERLEAASDGMMVWMREFNPIADSAGKDKAREYLEGELVKVQKVKADILDALEEGQH